MNVLSLFGFTKAKKTCKHKAAKQSMTFLSFAEIAKKDVKWSTSKNYMTATRSLMAFKGGKDVVMDSLTVRDIDAYENWLLANGKKKNTTSLYMRSLRSMYNKAKARRLLKDKKPFRNVFTGNEKTDKYGVTEEELRAMDNLELEKGSKLDVTRDIFILSFSLGGIAFVDLTRLRKDMLNGKTLTYYRQKTGTKVKLNLNDKSIGILSKYTRGDSDYLFPTGELSDDEDKKHRQIYSRLGSYNRYLKKIAKLADIDKDITSYYARHAWASLAYAEGISMAIISAALGHTNTKTTQIYIKGIDDNSITESNNKLIEKIFATSLKEVVNT